MQATKLIFSLITVIFGFSLVLVSALRLSFQSGNHRFGGQVALAQEETRKETKEGIVEATATAKVAQNGDKVDYYLPYPGILPDHPLYWLKMIRDRIMLWLTQEPQQRFQRILLYADKRIGAAQVLIEGGKVDLGVSTATKAEKYLEQSIQQYRKLKQVGKAAPETEDQLKRALLKHEEVLKAVLEKVPDAAKPALGQALESSRKGYEQVVGGNK